MASLRNVTTAFGRRNGNSYDPDPVGLATNA
jgi:hypothetical protein